MHKKAEAEAKAEEQQCKVKNPNIEVRNSKEKEKQSQDSMTSTKVRNKRKLGPFWTSDFSVLHFTFFLLLFSCNGESVLFTEDAEIGGDGWAHADSIRFAFTATDTTQHYNLRLEVRHRVDYAWQNLYVKIKTAFPDDSIKTDILSLELSDGIGKWAGHCGSEKCTLTIPLQQNLRFPIPGEYSLTFIQHMRQELVPGITGLSLSVVEAEK